MKLILDLARQTIAASRPFIERATGHEQEDIHAWLRFMYDAMADASNRHVALVARGKLIKTEEFNVASYLFLQEWLYAVSLTEHYEFKDLWGVLHTRVRMAEEVCLEFDFQSGGDE